MTTATYEIRAGDFEHGGSASRALKEQLKRVGADPAVVRRAMIAAYEAEMNVVIHSQGGELRADLQDGRLDVEVVDRGPGIPDIEQAMREGFSTASPQARELGFGAGMGLPNIRKNSDRFAIESTVGRGTTVRFTIFLRPQALYGVGRRSVEIDADRCRQSLRCLRACPTGAIRVFRGRPQILDYLCIDCPACVAACPTGALTLRGTHGDLVPASHATLVVPAPALVQFGAGVTPDRVLAELRALGFSRVRSLHAWDAALRAAVVEHATSSAVQPVISPACPAVVNLIETRFPSLLPHVAPFLSAVEATWAELQGQQATFVVLCPCQKTVLVGGTGSAPEIMLPAALRALVAPRVAAGQREPAPTAEPRSGPALPTDVLEVCGLPHVFHVLEEIENGQVLDVRVVEPWACDGGCFGAPLLSLDAHLARWRWERSPLAPDLDARAVRRREPLAPRKGLRLDDDMGRAIQKLGRIDRLRRTLPGSDCGMCGAPTCAALAEDIVLGRAHADACPRQAQASGPAASGPPASETEPKR